MPTAAEQEAFAREFSDEAIVKSIVAGTAAVIKAEEAWVEADIALNRAMQALKFREAILLAEKAGRIDGKDAYVRKAQITLETIPELTQASDAEEARDLARLAHNARKCELVSLRTIANLLATGG